MAAGRDGGSGGLMGKRRIGQVERKTEMGGSRGDGKGRGTRDERRPKEKRSKKKKKGGERKE